MLLPWISMVNPSGPAGPFSKDMADVLAIVRPLLKSWPFNVCATALINSYTLVTAVRRHHRHRGLQGPSFSTKNLSHLCSGLR